MIEDKKSTLPRSPTVAIIGAGLAGLSAGVYLRKAGFSTTIFEMNKLPGGQCTSWKKKGYTFDGCVHWLMGIRPGDAFYRIWEEMGIFRNERQFVLLDRHTVVRFADGEKVTIYSDYSKLKDELLRIAPEDATLINPFIRGIKKASSIKIPDPDDRSISGLLGTLRIVPAMISLSRRWGRISIHEYASRFQNPRMKKIMQLMLPGGFAMYVLVFNIAALGNGSGAYPVGGSLSLAKDIEETYLSLGGEIKFSARVTEIITKAQNDRKHSIAGLRYRDCNILNRDIDREEKSTHAFNADYIISAGDGFSCVEKLLGGRFHHPRIRKVWESLPLYNPLFYVSIGIEGNLGTDTSSEGDTINFDKPLKVSWGEVPHLVAHTLSFDPTLAPEGHSTVNLIMDADFDHWERLYEDPAYEETKSNDAKIILDALEDFYPGLNERIRVIDIATPMTWVRFTGVHRGAYEGFQWTPQALRYRNLPGHLKGLDNFFLSGQWVHPGGGLPTAVYSGKNVARKIIKHHNKST
jgi:phytoene dehydrogenase-like protein